jgi:hypothetical protein
VRFPRFSPVATGIAFAVVLPIVPAPLIAAEAPPRVGTWKVSAPAVLSEASWPAPGAEPAYAADDASAAARTSVALSSLRRHVDRKSHPEALVRAFHAYYAFRERNPELVRKPYLFYVDYGLDNLTPRGYVFDMESLTLVEGPFTVAHGRGSGGEGVPTRFSNIMDSAMSSLGLYLAQETYAFSGRSSGSRYHSVGLRLRGLSGQFNSAARARGIVAHGAPYVTAGRAGRSEGCPAMEEARARRLLPRIANGGMVYLFSPRDATWMNGDPWAGPAIGELAAAGR